GATLAATNSFPTSRTLTLGGGTDTVDVAAGFTLTAAGLVTGAGTLTKTGGGTLVLSDAGNNYSGGTTISGGVVSVGVDGDLGAAAGVTLNGGTLATTADLMTARTLTVSAASGLDI